VADLDFLIFKHDELFSYSCEKIRNFMDVSKARISLFQKSEEAFDLV